MLGRLRGGKEELFLLTVKKKYLTIWKGNFDSLESEILTVWKGKF
jgi:hypothetical protein